MQLRGYIMMANSFKKECESLFCISKRKLHIRKTFNIHLDVIYLGLADREGEI